jgi:uncharacterized protein (DUF2252 family)
MRLGFLVLLISQLLVTIVPAQDRRAALFAILEGTRAEVPGAPQSTFGVAQEVWAFNRERFASNPAGTRQKFLRMAKNAFVFYRGAAHLYYRDVSGSAGGPLRTWMRSGPTQMIIHGDFHLQNVGTFTDGRDKVRFDLQDFDESTSGPWILDVARAAVALTLAGRTNAIGSDKVRDAVDELVKAYVDSLSQFNSGQLDGDFSWKEDDAPPAMAAILHRAKAPSRKDFLAKRTEKTAIGVRLKRGPRISDLPEAVAGPVRRGIAQFARIKAQELHLPVEFFKVLDVGGKLGSGVGSVGLAVYQALVEGDSPDRGDDRILEIKEQVLPAPDRYRLDGQEASGAASPTAWATVFGSLGPGPRAVLAQRLLQSHPDRYLDSVDFDGRSYIVREVTPGKDGADPEDVDSPKKLGDFARGMGRLIAKGHYRQDRRPDLLKIEKQLGEHILKAIPDRKVFRSSILEFAELYALQVEKEYQEYLKTPLARGEPLQ